MLVEVLFRIFLEVDIEDRDKAVDYVRRAAFDAIDTRFGRGRLIDQADIVDVGNLEVCPSSLSIQDQAKG